jgi:hypothetical protein
MSKISFEDQLNEVRISQKKFVFNFEILNEEKLKNDLSILLR